MADKVIEFINVSKSYDLRGQSCLRALKDVSFSVMRGETIGIIGANGAGKTTILRLLAGVTAETKGKVEVDGLVAPLIQVGAGFHPELTGRENIYLNGIILGLSKKEIDRKFDGIVQFAELERFMDTPVKKYSSGMYVRLGFSVAVFVDTDILLVDEILSVGDVKFQKKCLNMIRKIKEAGKTIVFVSHNLFSVDAISDRVLVLDKGRVSYSGEPAEAIKFFENSVLNTAEGSLAPDGTQWNSGEFSIEQVEVLDKTDRPVEMIKMHEPLKVRINWKGKKRIERPNVTLNLFKEDGTRVCVERSSYHGFDFDPFQGEGTVIIQIESLPLKRGRYTVGLEISDLNTHIVMPEAYHKKASFFVEDHLSSVSEGIVSLDVKWCQFSEVGGGQLR